MGTAYIATLNGLLEAPQSSTAAPEDTLETRFLAWFEGLPEVTRKRPFAMAEFERAMGTQGKYLSPVLIRLGWQRKRDWSGSAHYNRYWVRPESG